MKVRLTQEVGGEVVAVGVLEQLSQEGHEITEHVAVGPGQLGDELQVRTREEQGGSKVNTWPGPLKLYYAQCGHSSQQEPL